MHVGGHLLERDGVGAIALVHILPHPQGHTARRVALAAPPGQRLLIAEQDGQHEAALAGQGVALVDIGVIGPEAAHHVGHEHPVPQPPERDVEEQREAEPVSIEILPHRRAEGGEDPVQLAAQSVIVLPEQRLFDAVGVEIGEGLGPVLPQLAEVVDALAPGKDVLFGAAVGLLVALRQHVQLAAQLADPGREGGPHLLARRLLQGADVREHLVRLELPLGAVKADHHLLAVQKEQPVQRALRHRGAGGQHPAPQGGQVRLFVPAVAVKGEHRHHKVFGVDARLGEHGQKALGVLFGGEALQQLAEPALKVAAHALVELSAAQPLVVEGGFEPPEDLLELVEIGGLEQVLGDMVFDGHVEVLEIAVAAQDHDLDLRPALPQPLHQLHPVHAGHADVREHHVRAALVHPIQHLLPVGTERADLVAHLLPGDPPGDSTPDVLLIVRDHQPVHGRLPFPLCRAHRAGSPRRAAASGPGGGVFSILTDFGGISHSFFVFSAVFCAALSFQSTCRWFLGVSGGCFCRRKGLAKTGALRYTVGQAIRLALVGGMGREKSANN